MFNSIYFFHIIKRFFTIPKSTIKFNSDHNNVYSRIRIFLETWRYQIPICIYWTIEYNQGKKSLNIGTCFQIYKSMDGFRGKFRKPRHVCFSMVIRKEKFAAKPPAFDIPTRMTFSRQFVSCARKSSTICIETLNVITIHDYMFCYTGKGLFVCSKGHSSQLVF